VYLVIPIEPHSGGVVLSFESRNFLSLLEAPGAAAAQKCARAPTFAGEISVKGYFISGAELLSFVAREREDTPL
jgi:hypothetical protein